MQRRLILTSVGLIALTSAELAAGRLMRAPDHNEGDEPTGGNQSDQSSDQQSSSDTGGDQQNAETREAAAAAGGYNLGSGASSPAPDTADEATTNLSQPNVGAADDGDVDDGRIETQAGREAAGPFTGTGNQDALRTAGRAGASDAHHADQRTSGDESAVEGQNGGGAEGSEQPASEEDEGGEA